MSIGGLDAALSGLRVAQKQLSVISTNISNVSTPGYSRKILPQSAITSNNENVGVRADTLIRQVDLNMTRDFWTQVSEVKALDVQAKYLNRVQKFHGDPAQGINIAADIAKLHDTFAALSDSPEDTYLQRIVLDQAGVVAGKISGFSELLLEMRNDVQSEMDVSVRQINDTLEQIAQINRDIKAAKISGRSTAALEDLRDNAVQKLSEELDISFFIRGDGVMTVQTKQGVQLVDERAESIHFVPNRMGANNWYPENVAGLYIGGNPATTPNAINITSSGLGGRLGALIELRDTVIPKQQAEIDELAHKLAMRLDQQGLRLFTNAQGQIPPNTAPVPDPPGPLSPVEYVGFARELRINPAIVSDNGLIQRGTVPTDMPIEPGSNEVIRRVVQFAFGDVSFQQAVGNIDLRADETGGTTMHDWLGIASSNIMTGTISLSGYADLDALMNAAPGTFGIPPSPVLDSFTLTFEDLRVDPGTYQITINLTDAMANHPVGTPPINDALDQLIAEINDQITAAGIPPELAATATRNPYGQLVLRSAGNLTVAADMPGGMREAGLELLGLSSGTQQTNDPYFEVRVGNGQLHRITIAPDDTEATLLAKLQYDPVAGTGVPGLYAEIDENTGHLSLRPGGHSGSDDPVFGGDIHIVGGPFTANGTGGSGVPAGASLMETLFGANNPVNNVLHSDINQFRTFNVGPGANINTGTISATSLTDFAQKMINRHTQEVVLVENRARDEKTYRDLLQQELLDTSGVNIDEELSHLIVVQNAYAAAARAVSALEGMFQELLSTVR